MKISELSELQKQHLVWRLDHKTGLGLLTACAIAQGKHGDLDLVDVFQRGGRSLHSAKIHARKVINFSLVEGRYRMKSPAPVIETSTQRIVGSTKVEISFGMPFELAGHWWTLNFIGRDAYYVQGTGELAINQSYRRREQQ